MSAFCGTSPGRAFPFTDTTSHKCDTSSGASSAAAVRRIGPERCPDLDHANLVPNDPAFPPSSQSPLVVPARDARTENYNGDRPNCAPHYTKRGAERRVIEQGREKCQSSSSAVPAS